MQQNLCGTNVKQQGVQSSSAEQEKERVQSRKEFCRSKKCRAGETMLGIKHVDGTLREFGFHAWVSLRRPVMFELRLWAFAEIYKGAWVGFCARGICKDVRRSCSKRRLGLAFAPSWTDRLRFIAVYLYNKGHIIRSSRRNQLSHGLSYTLSHNCLLIVF